MNVTLKNLANQISYVETNEKHQSIFLNEWLNSYCKGQSYGIHNDIQIAGEFKRILGNKFYRWTGLKWWCIYKSVLLLHKGQEGWRWTPQTIKEEVEENDEVERSSAQAVGQ